MKVLQRARAVSASFGKKTALAKFLGVPKSRVSEWLAGVNEPGGRVAFQILAWVEEEEAKQKTPGSVGTTAKGKQTRRRTSRNENQSDPPKPYNKGIGKPRKT